MHHLHLQGGRVRQVNELSGGFLQNYGVIKRGLNTRALRRIFGRNREKVTGGWRKLHKLSNVLLDKYRIRRM
jgi:hypothetical protein